MDVPTHSPGAVGNNKEVSLQPREVERIVGALRALLTGDEQEQRETFSFLKQASKKIAHQPASSSLLHNRVA
jgi:hypothetical protein